MCVCLGLSLNNHSNCEEGPAWGVASGTQLGGGEGEAGGGQESKEVSERGRGGFGRGVGGFQKKIQWCGDQRLAYIVVINLRMVCVFIHGVRRKENPLSKMCEGNGYRRAVT
jgi:hypothetical protein